MGTHENHEAFERLIERSRRELDERTKTADRLTAAPGGVRMRARWDASHRAVVSPSLGVAGGWRVTFLDSLGPSGHMEYGDKRAAVLDALSQRYEPIDR